MKVKDDDQKNEEQESGLVNSNVQQTLSMVLHTQFELNDLKE